MFPEGLRTVAAKVCGIDRDPAARENPHLDEVRISPAEGIPYPDETFDLVYAKYVLEHLATLASLATPLWFHGFVNSLRGRAETDTFPVFYRANTRCRIASLCEEAGLVLAEVSLHEPRPAYLEPVWPLFLARAACERFLSGLEFLSGLRFNMMGLAVRP